jgi:single-strand DNA-binding protein
MLVTLLVERRWLVEEGTIPAQVNEVRIRGRVSGTPRRRRLPSGDEVVSVRLVVPRPDGAEEVPRHRRPSVDTIECVAWGSRQQAVMTELGTDEFVFVTGALRRRFWRAGGVVASAVEVEVSRLQRVSAPAEPIRDRCARQASDA